MAYTKDANNLSSASAVIRNGENVGDAGGEALELLDDAVEGGAAGEDEEGRLGGRRVRV